MLRKVSNLPVGKRDFNSKMQKKLEAFIDRLRNGDYSLCNLDFRNISLDEYTDKSFFYVDPPYLITCATYNEQDGWNEEDEKALLQYLDELNDRKIRFALSNVLESRGWSNDILKEWLNRNQKKYRVIDLNYSYANSSYHMKQRECATREVLIVNY